MITGFILALALQAASSQAPPQVWIANMTLHAKQLTDAELSVAQHYASCISMPYFPMPDQFAAKRDKCRASSTASPSHNLIGVLDHVDSLVQDQPGSEASLRITKE